MAEPTQLAFRTLKGIGVLDTAPVYQPPAGFVKPEGNLRCCTYSPDGKFFAWASPEQVTVIDPSVGHVVTTLPAPNVYELGFSPLGTYIITWQRPTKDEAGDAVKNLQVWRTIDDNAGEEGQRQVVGKFVQKSQTGWNLQYTDDERYCARVVTNEVQFYESSDLATVWNKLRVEGVSDFAVAPGKTHSVAVFVPERKGQPAAVKLYNVPNFNAPISQKTFFKGDKVQLKWNSLGTSLIVLASTDVDKSNRSYYGESNMYLLSANGGFDSLVPLDKEGPIHDVTWSPNSKEFGVIYGYMPAKTVLFNTKAEQRKAFPLAPRNTILFSPHGRFVLIAGFGNLAGKLDIYDLQKDYAKVATIEASNASVCEWSPDGTHIMTAITSPRLRVDNGVRLWHVGGGLMYKEDMDELYHITWRPQGVDKHPAPVDDPLKTMLSPHESAVAYLGTVKTPSKPAGAYRPPGARGTLTPLHFKREDEGGTAHVTNGLPSAPTAPAAFGKGRRREVPGAEAADGSDKKKLPPGAVEGGGVSLTVENGDDSGLSKAALKNKKKREAKKAKDKAEAEGSGGDAGVQGGQGLAAKTDSHKPAAHAADGGQRGVKQGGRGPKPAQQQQQQQHQQAAATPAPAPAPAAPADDGGQDKRVRALMKKLRAIDELKMRQAGGEKLELSQISKIQTEEKVRQELDALGGSV